MNLGDKDQRTKISDCGYIDYTCSLGTGQENQILSLHRAKEVANVLRAHGYTVKDEDIKGRGEEIPLTTEKQNFAINRRVEITE